MLEIRCSGTPYEIGLHHGREAEAKIRTGLAFYSAFFQLKAGMDWPATTRAARKFMPLLEASWPQLVEEMRGIADGAAVPFDSILALNCRTEIAMGLMTDGCTSLAWKTSDKSYVAQNWDVRVAIGFRISWEPAQEENLVMLHIKRDPNLSSLPSICQVTEAGIIGKIGINAAGVGVCLNAIRVRGVDFSRLPGHLALRVVLDSTSRADAIRALRKAGIAAAIHILVADPTGATSIEASCHALVLRDTEDNGPRLAHSNHFLYQHDERVPLMVVPDESIRRVQRATALMEVQAAAAGSGPDIATFEKILEDQDNGPFGINKAGTESLPLRTLFSIVMDLDKKQAIARVGRPNALSARLLLDPCCI
ncbi:hypothetical protein SEPCBS119000_000266 [Sporothrix epigloea]|uniref:Peptidase C45 hydrolase domain-containing protein n=1 Tax=Sporothrix epigloea TaxID=1892477 RepID=A0ABP0D7V7_9PEZI